MYTNQIYPNKLMQEFTPVKAPENISELPEFLRPVAQVRSDDRSQTDQLQEKLREKCSVSLGYQRSLSEKIQTR
jgi:hypothetical protein